MSDAPARCAARPGRPAYGLPRFHDHDCKLAGAGGIELGIEEALDSMLRPGPQASDKCDAAAVLIPMLQLGQGYQ